MQPCRRRQRSVLLVEGHASCLHLSARRQEKSELAPPRQRAQLVRRARPFSSGVDEGRSCRSFLQHRRRSRALLSSRLWRNISGALKAPEERGRRRFFQAHLIKNITKFRRSGPSGTFPYFLPLVFFQLVFILNVTVQLFNVAGEANVDATGNGPQQVLSVPLDNTAVLLVTPGFTAKVLPQAFVPSGHERKSCGPDVPAGCLRWLFLGLLKTDAPLEGTVSNDLTHS